MMPTQIFRAISFRGPFRIDADGAPNAYHPEDKGLDYLANAGQPGNWWGIATDKAGTPFIQDAEDIYPGYYVSTTALTNPVEPVSSSRRYVDSGSVPYIALPPEAHAQYGISLGSLAKVSYGNRSVLAVVADVGPRGKWGEGSIALAELLRIPSSPKTGGIESPDVEYTVYGVGFPEHEIETGLMDDIMVLSHWSTFRWPLLREMTADWRGAVK